jgi:hypothetical protein
VLLGQSGCLCRSARIAKGCDTYTPHRSYTVHDVRVAAEPGQKLRLPVPDISACTRSPSARDRAGQNLEALVLPAERALLAVLLLLKACIV